MASYSWEGEVWDPHADSRPHALCHACWGPQLAAGWPPHLGPACSIAAFQYGVAPALEWLLAHSWGGTRLTAALQAAFALAYHALWLLPAYGASLVVNSMWCAVCDTCCTCLVIAAKGFEQTSTVSAVVPVLCSPVKQPTVVTSRARTACLQHGGSAPKPHQLLPRRPPCRYTSIARKTVEVNLVQRQGRPAGSPAPRRQAAPLSSTIGQVPRSKSARCGFCQR